MTTIIHKDLSYKVRGVLFHVHNALGPMLPERFYQAAVAMGLEAEGLRCETEKRFEVYYRGTRVGLYFVDVWVSRGKLLLELKVAPEITAMHRAQTLSYLKVTGADLGLIVNFGERSLTDERLPNYLRDKKAAFAWHHRAIDGKWLYPQLTEQLFELLHRVHFELGPGFLHQVYRRATMAELRQQGIAYQYVKTLPVIYEGHLLGEQPARLINIESKVLLATFAVRSIDEGMIGRLRARLRILGLRLGLLANFGRTILEIIPVRAT